MMSLLLKLNKRSLLQEIPSFVHHIYRFLLMDMWSHLQEEWGRSSFFPSHVSDEMKEPRLFRHLAVGRVGWAVSRDGMHGWLSDLAVPAPRPFLLQPVRPHCEES